MIALHIGAKGHEMRSPDQFLIDVAQDAYLVLLDRFNVMRGYISVVASVIVFLSVFPSSKGIVSKIIIVGCTMVIFEMGVHNVKLQLRGRYKILNAKADTARFNVIAIFFRYLVGIVLIWDCLLLQFNLINLGQLAFLVVEYGGCCYVRDREPPMKQVPALEV